VQQEHLGWKLPLITVPAAAIANCVRAAQHCDVLPAPWQMVKLRHQKGQVTCPRQKGSHWQS